MTRVDTAVQDCARCPQLRKCWDLRGSPSDAVLAINLLVCRLKLGLAPNKTTRLLLRLLRPKVLKMTGWIQRTIAPDHIDQDELIADMESATIEYLLCNYDMGEVAWPLHYLFGYPNGVMRGWAMNFTNKIRRHNKTHYSYGLDDDEGGDDLESRVAQLNRQLTRIGTPMLLAGPMYDEQLDAPVERAPMHAALRAVDDGVTLGLSEYRVLQFCLNNANPSGSVRGLHSWLAGHADVKRKTITKYYRLGGYRAIEAAGQTAAVLAARGVDLTGINARRRQRWLHGDPDPAERLTPAEIHGLLAAARQTDLTLHDVCWAYGIGDKIYYKLRDRYEGMTIKEIGWR